MTCMLLCSCSASETGAPSETALNTAGASLSPLNTQPSGQETADPYNEPAGINLLVAVDQFGRTVPVSGAHKENRAVGMMYWLWHGSYTSRVVDTTKIIEEKGLDYALYNLQEYNPAGVPHYWGEPLYGYYRSDDEYIIRRHMMLLMYAGVDFIAFDASNTITYPNEVRKICEVICELRGEGFNVPQITYYTHTASIQTVQQAYDEIYSHEEYREAWYCMEGKPLMIAQTDPAKDKERTTGQHAHLSAYDPQPLGEEIMDFFYFRVPAWCGVDPVTDDGWPWVDWNFSNDLYGNLMTLSPASHHYAMMSWSAMGYDYPEEQIPRAVWSGGNVSWGRGYAFSDRQNNTARAAQGSFFQAQWNVVKRAQPEIVYLDGWNEWCSGYARNAEYGNVAESYDSFNMEFSRDLELMKGGYNDAFLIQTAMNVKEYKCELPETFIKDVHKTIDINAGAGQWEEVKALYRCTGSRNFGRNARGVQPSLKYAVPAAVNSIQDVKVTCDADNIYFMIRCDGDIKIESAESMNLFIGTGSPELKGWEGYEYVLNREISGGRTAIGRLHEDFSMDNVGSAAISIDGGIMQISIPRSLIGMDKGGDSLYFKVADSVEHPEDIMDYYVTGRCMPMGRFSYQYLG